MFTATAQLNPGVQLEKFSGIVGAEGGSALETMPAVEPWNGVNSGFVNVLVNSSVSGHYFSHAFTYRLDYKLTIDQVLDAQRKATIGGGTNWRGFAEIASKHLGCYTILKIATLLSPFNSLPMGSFKTGAYLDGHAFAYNVSGSGSSLTR